MGTRFGKTTLAAYEVVAYALEPSERSVGWIVAPTYELSTRVFREVAHVFLTKLKFMVSEFREHEHLLKVYNFRGGNTGTCEIRGKSADAPVSLLGEGLDFLVVDEFARIKPEIWERYLSARLVDKDGHALLISTPKGKGLFYDLWRRGQGKDPHYESWNMPSWENPLLDRALIEAERGRLPQAVFDQEFGAAWIEGAGAVFRNVRELATGSWQEPVKDERYWGGLDLAKVEDFTVLVIVNVKREVVHVDRFNRVDWEIQTKRVKAACERYCDAELLVDSTGAGEPVFEGLRKAGIRCRGYKFTTSSKADLVNNLALMLERKQVVLPRPELWPDGIEELEAFQYSVTDAGNVSTGAPAGQHDDCAVAVMLAMWMVRREPARMVARWV